MLRRIRRLRRYPQAWTNAFHPNRSGRRYDPPGVHHTGQSMLARRLALAIAVLAGLIGSQGPEFAQQYRQRLGGALEELNRIVSEFDPEVQRQNLTRADGLKRLADNSDPLARERGEDMGRAIERAQRLDTEIQAITRPVRSCASMSSRRPSILISRAATLDNYEPAEPLSIGALTAGGLAALWGWAAARLIAWPFSRRSRLRAASAQSGTTNAG